MMGRSARRPAMRGTRRRGSGAEQTRGGSPCEDGHIHAVILGKLAILAGKTPAVGDYQQARPAKMATFSRSSWESWPSSHGPRKDVQEPSGGAAVNRPELSRDRQT